MTRLPRTIQRPVTRRAQVIVASVAALALSVGIGLTRGEDGSARDDVAFVDAQATDAVQQQVSALAAEVLTIRPAQAAATRARAAEVLIGEAGETYDELYGPYFELARTKGISLVTTVRAIGVTRLSDDEAELLLFADQTASAKGGRSGAGSAQVSLEARRVNGQWKISAIEVL